jgi:5'-deoxynucleotidase YfbR-like HD superfamily hydrolase
MSIAKRGTLYTYSGKVAFPNGAPTLLDIAISLSRECRFAGAGLRFWPVSLHTFVVCDLLPDYLKFDGLMHDSPEVISGDVPKPVKTLAIEEFEKERLKDIYASVKVTLPSFKDYLKVKDADVKSMRGEVFTVGTQALQELYERYEPAEDLIHRYIDKYDYADCLESSGRVPMEFMIRFRKYRNMMHPSRLRS